MALPFKPSTGGGGAAIGSVVTGLTAGSVPYGGAGGVLAQANTDFFYTAPGDHILSIGGYHSDFGQMTVGLIVADTHNNNQPSLGIGGLPDALNSQPGELAFFASAGTFTAPTPLGLEAVPLGRIAFWQWDDVGSAYRSDVRLESIARNGLADFSVSVRDGSATVQTKWLIQTGDTTGVTAPDAASTLVTAGQVEMQGGPVWWKGATSGFVKHVFPATITDYTLTWPAAAAPGALRFDGVSNLSWAAPVTVSDVTSARALNTTYANAYSNKAVMVFATVKCTTALLGGSATATPSVSTSATPTVSAGGTIGIGSGLAGEANTFQICFVVPAGSSQNYRLDTASGNGSASLSAWFEATF